MLCFFNLNSNFTAYLLNSTHSTQHILLIHIHLGYKTFHNIIFMIFVSGQLKEAKNIIVYYSIITEQLKKLPVCKFLHRIHRCQIYIGTKRKCATTIVSFQFSNKISRISAVFKYFSFIFIFNFQSAQCWVEYVCA